MRYAFGIGAILFFAPCTAAFSAPTSQENSELAQEVERLDSQLFGAYNRCDLAAYGQWFSSDVEFYHDDGGVTVGRDIILENTRRYICGKVERVLVPGSLKVYPIKDYGALEEGEHTFRSLAQGQGGGIAKFVIVWKHIGDAWQATRVMSYGHMLDPKATQ